MKSRVCRKQELFGTFWNFLALSSEVLLQVPARANSDICFDSVAADWHRFLKIEFASKVASIHSKSQVHEKPSFHSYLSSLCLVRGRKGKILCIKNISIFSDA